jgi:hypothetical protein
VAKRFIVAFVTFIGLIIPAAFALALLVAPARPAPLAKSCWGRPDAALTAPNGRPSSMRQSVPDGGASAQRIAPVQE